MEQLIELARRDARDGLLAADHALADHVGRDLERRARGALADASLQHVELPCSMVNLDVAHVAVLGFELLEDLVELGAGRLEARNLLEVRDRLGQANTGDDVLALRVREEVAVVLFVPSAGLRVKPTSVAEVSPLLPKTIVWMLTAVPRSFAIFSILR